MNTGPIVTIGGQEVNYADPPRNSPISGSPIPATGPIPPPTENVMHDQGVNLLFALALAASLLVVLTAIMTRNSRQGASGACCCDQK